MRPQLTGNCLLALLMLTVLRHVGMLVFLTSLSSAQTLRTGSLLISSCDPRQSISFPAAGSGPTHRDGDQQAGSLHLAHVRNPTALVCLETPHHLPVLAHNVDDAIARSEKQAVGARAHARYVVALEQLPGVLVGEGDLGDFEEVKRLPLRRDVSK